MCNYDRNFEEQKPDFTLRLEGEYIELLGGGALLIRTAAAGFASLTVGEALHALVVQYEAGGCRW